MIRLLEFYKTIAERTFRVLRISRYLRIGYQSIFYEFIYIWLAHPVKKQIIAI